MLCSLSGKKRFFIHRPASSGQEKRGDHKQTVNIEVSSNDVVECLPDLTTFHAGNLREVLPSWRKITSDINILDYVSGVKKKKFPLKKGLCRVKHTTGQVSLMLKKSS